MAAVCAKDGHRLTRWPESDEALSAWKIEAPRGFGNLGDAAEMIPGRWSYTERFCNCSIASGVTEGFQAAMQPIAPDRGKAPSATVRREPFRGAFLAWPGWPFLRFAWLLSGVNALWFALVYGGCDWLTAQHSCRLPIHLPVELSIPLIPSAVVIYMSIYLLFLGSPFIVRDRREFLALSYGLALATALGGVGFLLVPSEPAFAPHGHLGIWAGLFHFADQLNLHYNSVPSLHVAFSVCCIAAFAQHASCVGRTWLWVWGGAIALSTLFLHQHHLLDIFTGWVVGLWTHRTAAARFLKNSALLPLTRRALARLAVPRGRL